MRLKDKVAIVTGAGSGLGRAIAHRFAAEGSMVIVADVNAERMNAVVSEIGQSGGRSAAHRVDVTKQADLQAFMEDVVRAHGTIDILVNNAGITRYQDFPTIGDEVWDVVLDLDLKAVFYCAQAAAPHMVRQQSGKIVNISSSLGTGTSPHVGRMTPGGSAPYASAKAAVIQLTKTLARELGPSNINVNCVAPGFFLTPLTGATRSPEEVAEHIAARTKMAVLNRPGKVEDLANAVLFLASEESSFITGHTLLVDGGRTDRM